MASRRREEGVETRGRPIRRRRQPMPGEQQVWRGVIERLEGVVLIAKDLQGQPGVQFRIVQPPAFELSVLVVLDQVMIRIAGKSQGVETQGIHRRQSEQAQIGFGRGKMRDIEGEQVVTQQESRAFGKIVEPGQRRR